MKHEAKNTHTTMRRYTICAFKVVKLRRMGWAKHGERMTR